MWQYYAMLRLRYRTPLIPIVLYLSGKAGGIVEEEYVESLFGRDFLRLQYLAIGLPDLFASDYEESTNPLGPALSALMRSSERNRAVRWARIVRQEARIGIDAARLALIIDLLDRKLTLTSEEETTLATLTKTEEYQETDLPLTGFLRRAVVEGRTEGRQLGLAEGRAEGRAAGRTEAKRETLVELVRLRFGTLTKEQDERLCSLSEEAHLDRLLKALLSAESVDALLGQP